MGKFPRINLAFLIITILFAGRLCAQGFSENKGQPDQITENLKPDVTSYITSGEKIFYDKDLKKAREAFENILKIDSQNAQAQYFLGLIEYEEGNIEKAKIRFQIAHDCLGNLSKIDSIPTDTKQMQLEFPEDYKASVYYKDGWYVKSKDPSNAISNVQSLNTGSSYRIEIKSEQKKSMISRGAIGIAILLSFFLTR